MVMVKEQSNPHKKNKITNLQSLKRVLTDETQPGSERGCQHHRFQKCLSTPIQTKMQSWSYQTKT